MFETFNGLPLQRRLEVRFRREIEAGIPFCQLYSLTLTLSDFKLTQLPALPPPYLYWARPDENLWQLGLGNAWQITATGARRFDALSQTLDKLQGAWRCTHEFELADPSPGLFCALAFAAEDPMTAPWDALPNSTLFLPRLLLRTEADRTSVTFSCTGRELRRPEAVLGNWSGLIEQLCCALTMSCISRQRRRRQTPRVVAEAGSKWTPMVEKAIAAIKSGELEKVVTARCLRLAAPRPFPVTALVAKLESLFPSCLLFATNLGGATVVSATPERLARLRNGIIHCDALGGTTDRSADKTRDHKLALRLLNSPKSQHEHKLVVESVRSALEPLCVELDKPGHATVVKLHNVQHLWTGIKGRLRHGVGLLEAVRQLHPTPAVAGTPTHRACQWLRRHENLARGWYTGSIGWLQANGDGDFSVLLRCAVLQGCRADVFAGAGIVADSDPIAELHETELKLRAMLEAIQASCQQDGSPVSACGTPRKAGHS
jgi:isochorismate synthase